MMQAKLEKLFNEWQKKVKGKFVKDGVIDINNYKNIVWLLRETNDYEGDLAFLIKDCIENKNSHPKYWKTPQTHNKQSLAVYSILHSDLPNTQIKKCKECKKNGLKYAAVVNIKKTSGSNTSDPKTILKFLKEDISYIKEEIEILEPKIVIAGGISNKSYKDVKEIIIKEFELEKLEKFIYKSKSGIIFVETQHPAFRLIKLNEWIDFFRYVGKNTIKGFKFFL